MAAKAEIRGREEDENLSLPGDGGNLPVVSFGYLWYTSLSLGNRLFVPWANQHPEGYPQPF